MLEKNINTTGKVMKRVVCMTDSIQEFEPVVLEWHRAMCEQTNFLGRVCTLLVRCS